ncbi:MAG: Lrp/AsnC family transcriptional regulator [Verrucomicrobiota bacterium]
MDELLKILMTNAQESPEDLSKQLDLSVDEVKTRIADLEKRGIIRGYQAIVDEDQLDTDRVTAVIEVKVTPEREGGFDQVAKRIARFQEVRSMYLVSGNYDLLLFVESDDLKRVASFVSEKLATMDGVNATATHFMLKTYKHRGVLMESQDDHERLKVSP